MDQQRVEAETVQSPTRGEIVHMDHSYDDKSQDITAELINDDHQTTSDSLDNKEAFEPDNRADESEETSCDNQSTQSSSQLSGEVAGGSSGYPQEVEHSETQSLPSSIEHSRIQMISDSSQVAPDFGIDHSQDTNQTVQDDQMSVDGIEASNSMLLLQQEGFPLIEVYLGEDPIEALHDAEYINDPAQFPGVLGPLETDAEECIANEPSAQFPGVLDPLKADQQASSESSPPSQGTNSDATKTASPESSESAADVHPLPDIASSMDTLDKGKQIVSLPLTASTRKILKSFTSNVGGWKSRLRSRTLVNKKCKNTKETKFPPKSRSTSSSSSSYSVQEFRVRDRNEIQAEKLPTTNAKYSL